MFISFSIFLSFPLTNVSFSFLRCSHTSSAPRLLFLWPASFFFCLYRSFILSRVSSAVINLAGGIPEGYLTLIYELAILRRPRIFFFFFLPLSFSLRFLAPFARFLAGQVRGKRRPPRRARISRKTFKRCTRVYYISQRETRSLTAFNSGSAVTRFIVITVTPVIWKIAHRKFERTYYFRLRLFLSHEIEISISRKGIRCGHFLFDSIDSFRFERWVHQVVITSLNIHLT